MQKMSTVDRTRLVIYKKGEEPSDVVYWLSRPYEERLSNLEGIRREYNYWKYGAEPRLQRVYKVIKRT